MRLFEADSSSRPKGKDPPFGLMPMPAKIAATQDRLRLTARFDVAIPCDAGPRLQAGVQRAMARLARRTRIQFPRLLTNHDRDSASLRIKCRRPGALDLREDESYTLQITGGYAILAAETDLGVLHGLETLLQLVAEDWRGFYLPGTVIYDTPRFPWRGLMIDSSRHFLPMEVLLRNLDGMAAVKLNVLHWHLTDDQGFRVESKVFPKLHELGSDGLYYTQGQIREIVQYADLLGIRVVPEFDLPGHATSWFVGHPEFASVPGPYRIERSFGIKDPTFDPAREETYAFLERFLGEMAALFPDTYVHIGGDENNFQQWRDNQGIREFMAVNGIPDFHALQGRFCERLERILARLGKKIVGWDEILHPSTPREIVIQSWRGREAMATAVVQGYQSLLSHGYYLDLGQSAEYHYANDPIPADSALSEEEKRRILGGEAAIWTELATAETVDSRIWPRAAAIAERLWSPREIDDPRDMYRRLEAVSADLAELGLRHLSYQEPMLRRLACGADITPLKTLADVVEPLKEYRRHAVGGQTTETPLTEFADAAHPDADAAREFRRAVAMLLAGERDRGLVRSIRRRFKQWRHNHGRILRLIRHSPGLKSIESLSEDLAVVSRIGLQALAFLLAESKTAPAWRELNLTVLAKARTPRAEVELMLISAVEEMVERVGETI